MKKCSCGKTYADTEKLLEHITKSGTEHWEIND
jgi:hypothetical protein